MNYTVNELAKLSGVTIRTLRYYDDIGLLKPAFVGENNYRYYQEEQLLRLQQILFFKELGLDLKQIQDILCRSDFDTLKVLRIHAKEVQQRMKQLKTLSETVDKTIKHLEGKQSMKDKELYYGFDSERQKKYEQELEGHFSNYGDRVKQEIQKHIAQSKKNVQNWSKENWEKSNQEFNVICTELADLMKQHVAPDDKKVLAVIKKHFVWLSKFWTPNKESYKSHGQFIRDSELKNAYENHTAGLSEFVADAIQAFAQHCL